MIKFWRRAASWAFTAALALGALGFVVDAALLSLRAALPVAIGTAITAAALGTLLGFVAALPLAAIASLHSLIAVAVAGTVVGVLATDALYRPHAAIYFAIALAFGVAIALAAWLARSRLRWLALAGVLAAVALDAATPHSWYEQLHDLLAIAAASFAAALLTPLRRRLEYTNFRIYALLPALAVLAIGWCALADRLVPGFRAQAWQWARWQTRFGRAARALADFDLDGHSAVAWGGDCDDFDKSRHPLAREIPADGIDQNSTVVDPPLRAGDGLRGLAPAYGKPRLAAGAIDRVVLITIDSWRFDGFGPRTTPNLARLAERGVIFDRLYAGGTRTEQSLPLISRPAAGSPSVAARLAELGVPTAMIFGAGTGWLGRTNEKLRGELLDGTQRFEAPDGVRFTDAEVSTHGLAALDALGARGFLWLHYFGPHVPWVDGSYDAELAIVDREAQRVIDRLDLARTMVIVCADHGESFGEHGTEYHGMSAFEPLVHVPGFVLVPGLAPAHYLSPVSHRDLPATIVGAFAGDAEVLERFGRSWLRLIDAPTAPLHLFVVSRSTRASRGDEYSVPMHALMERRYKLIATYENDLYELYDPRADPDEKRDLAWNHPTATARLRAELAMYRDLDGWP
jgi:hypothetical protein